MMIALVALSSVVLMSSCNSSNRKADANMNHEEGSKQGDSSLLESLFGDKLGDDQEDVLPKADTDYISPTSGDKWGFVTGVSGDGSDPINLAHFLGNGMQGRNTYEMRAATDKRQKGGTAYELYDAAQPCGITVFIYSGADSIMVTRDGRKELFKTAESFDRAISSDDPDYTPERYAIKAGDHGGKWEVLQSGETAYVFPSGEYARSQWVKDGGKLYYVDVSGCRMINNWAHDGFYAGSDGSWDPTVKCPNVNLLPQNGRRYVDESNKSWTFNMRTESNGTIEGTAHMAYPKDIGYEADYSVKSFGQSAYSLYNVKDEFDCWHVVVLDGGQTLRVSGAGVTEVYQAKVTSIGLHVFLHGDVYGS